jgi:hypothetical protein
LSLVARVSVAQSKAARRRIKLRYPPPRRKVLAGADTSFMKKGQKLGKR